ncbi:polyketide synthase dehydratase domain-containing protein, partial [Streptomyces sp. FH025]|uniref:polyketide synthase dehydratase domain-containing protein n=1 Tax=Streptomyces sp. FH025 TaxID=2815937 RepID=UPI001A9DC98F
RAVAAGLTHNAPTITVLSTATGAPITAEGLDWPEYWVRHARGAVRFNDAVRALYERGVTTFVELGPDGVLTAMARDCLADQEGAEPEFISALRKDRPEPEALAAALAQAWTRGLPLDWSSLVAGRRVDLPHYPFQHKHYWLSTSAARNDDATAIGLGLGPAGHPLLGAAVSLADSDGLVLTGRLSLDTHPWLADHAVFGSVLFPGAALVELGVRAGDQVGCDTVDELMLEAPLALPATGGLKVQVTVGAADESGRRTFSVHSRAEGEDEAQPWLRHGTGVLSAARAAEPADLSVWPPQGAERIDLTTRYDDMAALGLEYGPAFQGLRAAWRRGEEVFAEVALDQAQTDDARRFGLHPALLDAALHAIELGALPSTGETRLPFIWTGVRLYATGAATARVRLASAGSDAVSLLIADGAGRPVATVESLALRPMSREQLAGAVKAVRNDALFEVEWTPVTPNWTLPQGTYA